MRKEITTMVLGRELLIDESILDGVLFEMLLTACNCSGTMEMNGKPAGRCYECASSNRKEIEMMYKLRDGILEYMGFDEEECTASFKSVLSIYEKEESVFLFWSDDELINDIAGTLAYEKAISDLD